VVSQHLIGELVELAGFDVLFKLPVPTLPLIVREPGGKALQFCIRQGGDGLFDLFELGRMTTLSRPG
jgi:hypothetical protein